MTEHASHRATIISGFLKPNIIHYANIVIGPRLLSYISETSAPLRNYDRQTNQPTDRHDQRRVMRRGRSEVRLPITEKNIYIYVKTPAYFIICILLFWLCHDDSESINLFFTFVWTCLFFQV